MFAIAWLIGCLECRASATATFMAENVPSSAISNLELSGLFRVSSFESRVSPGASVRTSPRPLTSHFHHFHHFRFADRYGSRLIKQNRRHLARFFERDAIAVRMPRRDAALEAAIIAAGVAKPMAQGHATIRTAAAVIKAPARAPEGTCGIHRKCESTWLRC